MVTLQQLLAPATALISAASCIAFSGPKATPLAPHRLINGWIPKPTQGPSPDELRKRQFDSAATCGWVDGIYSSEIGCPFDATCMLLTDVSPGMAGCCTNFDFQNCGYVSSCMDYSTMMSGACDSACMANSFIKKCTDSFTPYCVSWTYISDNVQDYGCGTEAFSTFETLQQDVTDSSNFITTSLSLPYVGQNIVTGYESTATAAAGSRTTRTSKASTTSPDTAQSAKSTSTSSKKTKVPVGLIAGVAGGVFILILAISGLVIFLCLRRKHKRTAAANATALAAASASRPQSQYYPPNNGQPMQQNNMLPPPMPQQSQEGYSYFGQPNQPYSPEMKFGAQTQVYGSSPISAPQTPAPAYQTPAYQAPGVGGYAPVLTASHGPPPRPRAVEVDATCRPHLATGGPIHEIGVGR